ncbi:hypothetical protein BDA96_10G227800 [Sorghum bicolor]|uniref:BED-type domain-containing protein n=1 Tax=Sorghum bicolor TaxID=4558 RepID=A0A921U1U6_SORBI|nr:hypothetical protein BDA96_10G227800 [Sorghum bicolor]
MTESIEVVSDHEEGGQEEVELQDQPSGKHHRKKSHVCKDFEELEFDDPNLTSAKCRICKKILTARIKNGTSHLVRHIQMHDIGQASLELLISMFFG